MTVKLLQAEVMEPGDKLSVAAEERRIKNGSISHLQQPVERGGLKGTG